MSKYAIGILLGFAAPILHAGANILDGYFANKVFERLGALVAFSALINVLFLPIICLIDTPSLLSPSLLAVVLVIAVIEVGYQYPYLWALRRLDTSIVTSLFSLGKLVTPLLALAVVAEKLSSIQYIGFGLVVVGSGLLTFDFKALRPDRGLWLMLLVSIGLSLQAVLYKYVFDHGAGWASVIVWSTTAEVAISGSLLFVRANAVDFSRSIAKIRQTAALVAVSQTLTWVGSAAAVYALLIVPVSVVNGIDGTQAIFVVLLTVLFARGTTGRLFRQHAPGQQLAIKSGLFLLICAGAWLISMN
jgi:drug/metabolite transporter (DMT)-like permease